MTELMNRPFTFGEKACGVSFNPGGDPSVAQIKADFAALVDNLHNMREVCNNGEKARMLSLAITEVQTAQMWAVKAVTWGH
jgi:hypothetical protein